MDFIGIKEQCGIQIRAGSSFTHQVGDAPRDDHEQRQSTLQTVDGTQLQCFDLVAVLDDVEKNFEFPPCAVPIDQFGCLPMRGDVPFVNSRHSTALVPAGAFTSRATTQVTLRRPLLPLPTSIRRAHNC